ncbi:guanylate kinase [Propylenella binzhouense]|uniref:Guanylate kinase n=1 Tax=Propylenella binzhouense TaxID=2555902 RepID=A0A964WTW2_9HYPH|nr:guanylate kinase [Propylenella binzhouense]MYZ48408.1 guanylate kinase [Propylenella binzhouense]
MNSEPPPLPRRGLMFVLSSPSGAGKSTLTRLLLQEDRDLQLSISVTTRARRPSEVEGRHYHFIDREEFARMRAHGDLLEWAEVHGNFYGTPRAPVERALAQGRDVLFDIDWQGTEQLCRDEALAQDIVRLFVLPPSFRELKARLERRAEDSADVIERRLRNAIVEIGKWFEYDYVIVNHDLERSFQAARSILIAERFRRTRFTELSDFVSGLLAEGEALLGAPEPEDSAAKP